MSDDKPKLSPEEIKRRQAEAARLIEQAEDLFGRGEMVEAAQVFLQAVELDPRSVRGWNDLGVVLHGLGEGKEAMTAFRTALALEPGNEDATGNMAALQTELDAAAGEPSIEVTAQDIDVAEPWPLATEAALRVLAWPDYQSPDELDHLLSVVGKAIAARDDACLCLRLDPNTDGTVVEASRALREAHQRALGEEDDLEVLLVAEPMSGAEWARLAAAVQAVVVLPSSREGHRAGFLLQAGLPLLETAADLGEIG